MIVIYFSDTDDPTSKLGSRTINQVTIVNDDGNFRFLI